ncbi:DNA mismatch repair endonuclease MutL [Crocosphaera sp. UHCC 0190]|uniref:DNA mismatch repair endonuclease MutL n=1 Tax=Crocosphaera sp. UHCC 0190 TaxID=3110246 RepID=UPI002B213070|nr:DNA mismatch repair endonuclease MutL [Crocosphaera sp. UHCC 0190]MEA5509468.1 DNA mismatch repair endonuclease MutL [Crocosphaera sp. UHCC 0190]
MSPPIKPLSPHLINLIAAGEVIDSFAAVVRELVENSLDAGATRLVISLYPEIWQVKVTDNGQGMSLEDLRNCGKPHSTSKICDLDDLWKITSLGFRGEALHSIIQVAELEVISRQADEDGSGWCLRYNLDGDAKTEETAPIAPGTIITVSNLFGRIPIRRQGLPAFSQQLKAIQSIIENLALCHPQITWQVQQNNQSCFNISPGRTPQQILPQLLKRVHFHDLQYLSQDIETQGRIEVVLGLPDRTHRGRPDWVKVGVNGRVVRSPQLEQTILAAFSRTLPKNRFPICFIHLKIPPNQIDWNRHPAKTEIYLQSLDFWQENVTKIIEQTLRLSSVTLDTYGQNQRVKKLLKVSEDKGSYQVNSKKVNQLEVFTLRAVGQVNQTYIVAEHSSGLWLIEQHIAHERVLYEKLQDNWQLIPLDSPIILTKLSQSQVEQLQRIGLEIELFGEHIWAVRTVPQILSQRDDCAAALLELSLGGDLETAQVATACRSAIRNGTTLNVSEMQDLLDSWKKTRNPRTCPHGRPIYLSLEESSLSRFFRRHWVIGKSHGLGS